MTLDFPLQTWTIFLDYGGAPVVWTRDGKATSTGVGMLLLHAYEMSLYVPEPLGTQFDNWGATWESTDAKEIDWLFFHQEGLRMSALLALWVAQFNIMIRYCPPYEDSRFNAYNSEIWMDPGTVARWARGLPSLQDDLVSWRQLLTLYSVDTAILTDLPTPLQTSGCA